MLIKVDVNLSFYYCSYLARNIVEKLEVVNKKWVRVRLNPGQSVDGSVSCLKHNNKLPNNNFIYQSLNETITHR